MGPSAQHTYAETSIWGETFIVVVFFAGGHGGVITTGNAREFAVWRRCSWMKLTATRGDAGNVGSSTLPRPTREMGTVGGEAEGRRETDDKFPVTIDFDDGRLLQMPPTGSERFPDRKSGVRRCDRQSST